MAGGCLWSQIWPFWKNNYTFEYSCFRREISEDVFVLADLKIFPKPTTKHLRIDDENQHQIVVDVSGDPRLHFIKIWLIKIIK